MNVKFDNEILYFDNVGYRPDIIRHPNEIPNKDIVINTTDIVYYVYRDIIPDAYQRIDVTVILPGFIGSEFNKTIGHYHIGYYPEVYQVLQGTGYILMQNEEVAYLILIKENDIVVIPPKFAHQTYNIGTDNLILVNKVSRECKNNYDPMLKNNGMAYYIGLWSYRNYNYDIPLEFKRQIIPNKLKVNVLNSEYVEYLEKPERYIKEWWDII